MGVEVKVIPTSAELPTWGGVRRRLLGDELPAGAQALLGREPRLYELGSNREVPADKQLTAPGHYYFGLHDHNTLGLHVHPVEDAEEAGDYVGDFGRNVGAAERARWIEAWSGAGHSFSVSSFGGRHEFELFLFVGLAAALCDLSSGVVMVMDDCWFGLGAGLHPGAVFRQAGRTWWERELRARGVAAEPTAAPDRGE